MNDDEIDCAVRYWPLFDWAPRADAVTKKIVGLVGALPLSDNSTLTVSTKREFNAWYGYSSVDPKMQTGPYKTGVDAIKAVFSLLARSDEVEAELAIQGMTAEPWVAQ